MKIHRARGDRSGGQCCFPVRLLCSVDRYVHTGKCQPHIRGPGTVPSSGVRWPYGKAAEDLSGESCFHQQLPGGHPG